MSLRLSIIIPFYNVEQFIAECLESVFQQDIPEEEYEVICVNDGSPDHSRDIVLEYQKNHLNLVLVEHEVNKKLGAARNTGRAVAKGNYIWNVDSDDKIVPNCLSKLLKMCEDNALDVLEFGTMRLFGENVEDVFSVKQTADVVSGLGFMTGLTSHEVSRMCPVWNKLIRRGFLDTNGVFSPEINMGEDVPFSFKILMLAKRMMVISDRSYIYRANPASLTGMNWKPSPYSLYEKCFQGSRLIYEVAMEVPKQYTSVQHSYIDAARYTLSCYMDYLPYMSLEDRKLFRSICRKEFFTNRYVKELLSIKGYANYQFWLLGLKSLPK